MFCLQQILNHLPKSAARGQCVPTGDYKENPENRIDCLTEPKTANYRSTESSSVCVHTCSCHISSAKIHILLEKTLFGKWGLHELLEGVSHTPGRSQVSV